MKLTWSPHPSRLSIYRWANQTMATAMDHPILPLIWQRFFRLYLERPASQPGYIWRLFALIIFGFHSFLLSFHPSFPPPSVPPFFLPLDSFIPFFVHPSNDPFFSSFFLSLLPFPSIHSSFHPPFRLLILFVSTFYLPLSIIRLAYSSHFFLFPPMSFLLILFHLSLC